MTDKENGSPFHENSLHVTAFLGGTTFAAMVLIIEFREAFATYSHWLIAGTALVSFLFIVSTVGNIHIASGKINSKARFTKFIEILGGLGFLGLGIIVPFLVYPFNHKGGIGLAFVEGIVLILFAIFRVKAKQ